MNAVVVLRHHPLWKDRIAWDEHAHKTIVNSPPWHADDDPGATVARVDSAGWRPWTDTDTARLSSWIRREIYGLDLPVADCERAVAIASEANPVHLFRNYLDSLVWDDVVRLNDWLSNCLGVPRDDYSSRVGTWWVLSAVARTYKPGCKADSLLILEGPQGIKKSTALKTLVGPRWFSDSPLDLRSKDAYQALQGKDDTGNRRYWPVKCGEIDLEKLAADRDQIWAEAVARFRAGARWWPEGQEEVSACALEQEERVEADAWVDNIIGYANGLSHVSVADVWVRGLGGQIDRLGRADEMRISRVLRSHGYRRVRVTDGDRRTWVFKQEVKTRTG